MNKHVPTSPLNGSALWERPTKAPELSDNRSPEDISQWWALIDRVIDAAKRHRWSKSEVARRANMADGTFSQWFSGKYNGRLDTTNLQVQKWLDALQESAHIASGLPQSPDFMTMRCSREIFEHLAWAQMCPDLVMITLGPGMGKTEACAYYEKSRPHVYRATVSENTKTVHGMLVELADELGVHEHNPARLARAIGNKVKRIGDGTLLIIDEGQHLNDEALNQLRHFVDIYKCGVAIVGNAEVYGRFTRTKPNRSYGQLKSRIGRRLHRNAPYSEDLSAFIAAWGVSDPACVQLLTGIGMKGGAFRQIDKTMKLATMAANGQGVTLGHIQQAWKQRDVEDIA